MIYNKGFTLIEILIALGIMSIAIVFLIGGVYNIEMLSYENEKSLEMNKILQSKMEVLLCQVDNISNTSFYYEGYLVEVILEPFEYNGLMTLQLIISCVSGKETKAAVVYKPNTDY